MKKLILLFTATVIGVNLMAQVSQPSGIAEEKQGAVLDKREQPEGMIFKEGKVFLLMNGQTSVLTEEIWTKNGMQVTPSGTLIFANGEKAKLGEEDFVTMDGAVARTFQVSETDKEIAYDVMRAKK